MAHLATALLRVWMSVPGPTGFGCKQHNTGVLHPPPTTATWDGGRRDWRGPLLVGPQGPVEPSVIHPTMGTLTRKDAPGPGSPRSSGPQRRGRWWSPFPWEDLEPSQSSFAWSAG